MKNRELKRKSYLSIRNGVQTESNVDPAYQDIPLPERPASQDVLGPHTQLVEAEVHESSDQGDSVLESALPSIHYHKAKRMYSREGSLEFCDQATSDHAATVQRSLSLNVDLSDEEYQHVVTNDGK